MYMWVDERVKGTKCNSRSNVTVQSDPTLVKSERTNDISCLTKTSSWPLLLSGVGT